VEIQEQIKLRPSKSSAQPAYLAHPRKNARRISRFLQQPHPFEDE